MKDVSREGTTENLRQYLKMSHHVSLGERLGLRHIRNLRGQINS